MIFLQQSFNAENTMHNSLLDHAVTYGISVMSSVTASIAIYHVIHFLKTRISKSNYADTLWKTVVKYAGRKCLTNTSFLFHISSQ